MTFQKTPEDVTSSTVLDEFGETSGTSSSTASVFHEDTNIYGDAETERTETALTPNSYQLTQAKDGIGETSSTSSASYQERIKTSVKNYRTGTSVTSRRKRMKYASDQRMAGAEYSRKGPDSARAPSPAVFLSDALASEEQFYKREDEEDIRCRQLWFLCSAIAGTMVIPLGLTFLGYMSYHDSYPNTYADISHISNSSITVMTSMTHPYPVRKTKPNSSTFLDQNCLGELNLSDDISNLTGIGAAYSSLNTLKNTDFFCLFNNSRFRSNGGFDYIPEFMPFGLCPNVVYWSMSIEDGRVTSRVPDFDRSYGIWKLKNISDRLSGNKSKVLMALGGYPEDSPHFARLGKDPVAMDSLVADIVACITVYRMDGIAIHWVLPAGACRPNNVTETLSTLLRNVKRLLTLNNLSALITLFLPYGDSASVSSLGNMVDFFFFMTHQYRPSRRDADFCEDIKQDTLQFITNIPEYSLHQGRICIGISMAIFPLDLSGPNSVRDVAPLYELCGRQRLRHLAGNLCDQLMLTMGNSRKFSVYARMKADQLENLLYEEFTPRSGGPSCRCALVADLEFDTYKHSCFPFSLYDGLQRLYTEVK